MKILVIGGGGREHALAWKIAQSELCEKLYIAPGNAGTATVGENVDINADDINGLLKFARENKIDLTVVGPEMPLTLGIVDTFSDAGLLAFGPNKNAAELEGSKAFMKNVLSDANIPTARYELHTNKDEALKALGNFGERVVIKADGLAAGKGVIVATSRKEAEDAIEQMMEQKAFGTAGETIIMEETLDGEEASILAFCDGKNLIMMPSSQDHKRIGDGDTGPNTGGMGAYSPAPVITPELEEWIEKNVMRKTLTALTAAGSPYKGILYAGLMITKNGPKVLEFNCRFGDPECQPVLSRMKSDIVPVLKACAEGNISGVNVEWLDDAAVCVVMAAGGYPASYEKGKTIHGLKEAGELGNVTVFHAGTKPLGDEVVTSGGRVLGITATGDTVPEAIDTAYRAVAKIKWDGAYYRKDIGLKAAHR
ncbi:Phosphoribosylamine--glycine ligase [hydrothermal vent metagenome]|uniref:phosphoribosylamine--glycine ligase n=1 Tax=hydrothermal vent metagenome TaxID=652676 RepID=A0A3B1C9K9_9ZZZZ